MAKSISEEELQLRKRARRRLVGAIALVTVIAVFLPMVLDHEPKPVSQDVSIKIPSPDAGVFTSKIVPVAPAQKSAPAPAPEAAAQVESTTEAPAKVLDLVAALEASIAKSKTAKERHPTGSASKTAAKSGGAKRATKTTAKATKAPAKNAARAKKSA